MRTPTELAEDQRRLAICARIERQIERVASRHPGLSLREIAATMPADEGTRLLALVDEVEMWSRETHPVETTR